MREKHPQFFLPDEMKAFLDWMLVQTTLKVGRKVDKADVIRDLIKTHPEYKNWVCLDPSSKGKS